MADIAPEVDQELEVLNKLRQEFLQVCAQAGEQQFIMANCRKKLTKLNIQLRKIDKKAGVIITTKKAQEAQKVTPIKAV